MESTNKPNAAVSRSATKPAVLNLKTPDSMLNTAVNLAKFIKENKLSSNIKGKEYVQVEGWQFAGTRLGIIPKMGLVEDLSTDTEIRFRATVSLYDLHNKIELGGGVAECSNKERTKKFYESYAICSMAQTRAVGKAYRNVLAWLIKAAGFEATPWEEMTDVVDAGTSAQVVEAAPAARPTQPAAAPVATPPASTTAAPSDAPAESGEPGPVTAKQRTILLGQLDSPLITEDERKKSTANIDKLNELTAADAIVKMKGVLAWREASNELYEFAKMNEPELGHLEVSRLLTLCKDTAVSTEALLKEKELGVAYLADEQTLPLPSLEEARQNLRSFADEHAARLGQVEYTRLVERSQAKTTNAAELVQELLSASEVLHSVAA